MARHALLMRALLLHDFILLESVIGYGHTCMCIPTAAAKSEVGVLQAGSGYASIE